MKEAVVCYLIKGSKITLGIRKKSSSSLAVNKIAGIGGKLEKEETPEQALVREFIEEIGTDKHGAIVCKPISWLPKGQIRFTYDSNEHKKWEMHVHIFIITAWKGTPIETNEIKPITFSIKDIPYNRMFDDNVFWLPRVLNGDSINEHIHFSKDLSVHKHIKFN